MVEEIIYLDTNVFVLAVLSGGSAKQILLDIATGHKKAVTSVITWDETVWALRKVVDYEFAKTEGRRLLLLPNLSFVDLSLNIVYKAQELIEGANTKPRDALHAATARVSNATFFISDDTDFDGVKDLKRTSISRYAELIKN